MHVDRIQSWHHQHFIKMYLVLFIIYIVAENFSLCPKQQSLTKKLELVCPRLGMDECFGYHLECSVSIYPSQENILCVTDMYNGYASLFHVLFFLVWIMAFCPHR